MMLTWLVSSAACPRPRMSFGSNSRPTRNMKSISPAWLRVLRCVRLSRGNSASDSSGATQPRSDGPRQMPAAISPTTCG